MFLILIAKLISPHVLHIHNILKDSYMLQKHNPTTKEASIGKTRKMRILSNFQKLDSLFVIHIINILNYFKTLQESQHYAPTLNGNSQYQNATISLIKVPNSSLTSMKYTHKFLYFFPLS